MDSFFHWLPYLPNLLGLHLEMLVKRSLGILLLGFTGVFLNGHWRACSKRLATRHRLRDWGMAVPATCVSCQHSDENHGHLFFYCSFSRVVWADLLRRNLILRCPGDWDFETGDWDFDIGWASLHYKG